MSLLAAAAEAAAKSSNWNSHDTRLVVSAALGIALIIVLIAVFKMHPFLALVLGSALSGFASGVGAADVIGNFEDGVGATLQEVGLLIALGAMLGKLLADSGGADRVVDTLVGRSGKRALPWAMALVAVIIGLPMFFEIGLVLLLPVIVLVTKKSGLRLMRVAIPALAGLSVLRPWPRRPPRASSRRSRAGCRASTWRCWRSRSERARFSSRTSTTRASGWSTRASVSPWVRRSRPGR
jgi:GntP family gluconate:H+ symporter